MDIIKWLIGLCLSSTALVAFVLYVIKYAANLAGKTYLERLKADYQKDIKELEGKLAVLTSKKISYSSSQFKFYNKLWSSLYELKISSENLWLKLNSRNLEKFSKRLIIAEKQIERGSLFIEDYHYKQIMEIISLFKDYQVGKRSLAEFTQAEGFFDIEEAERLKQDNFELKERLSILIVQIRDDLKKQIK